MGFLFPTIVFFFSQNVNRSNNKGYCTKLFMLKTQKQTDYLYINFVKLVSVDLVSGISLHRVTNDTENRIVKKHLKSPKLIIM
jgi:hypothetical protein